MRHGLESYFGSSVKGEVAIDWPKEKARRALLQKIVADAGRVVELARQAQERIPADSPQRQAPWEPGPTGWAGPTWPRVFNSTRRSVVYAPCEANVLPAG